MAGTSVDCASTILREAMAKLCMYLFSGHAHEFTVVKIKLKMIVEMIYFDND